MLVLDAFSLTLSVLGIYSLVLALRYLIPCYAVMCLWARLSEAQQLLIDAEAIDAVPPGSEHRTHLDCSANLFREMRMQINEARGPLQQLRLAIQCGLTCRLYVLYYRIESIKSELELAIDKQQLRITDSESAPRTAVPSSAAATATASVVVPTPSMTACHPSGGVAAAAATPADVVVLTSALAATAMITSHLSGGVAAAAATPADVVVLTPALAATAMITSHLSAPTATPEDVVLDPIPALLAALTSP